jgi:hypothetical protein
MGTKIEDGTGAGYEAEVTSNREVSVTSGSALERARAKGDAYSWTTPSPVDNDINVDDTLLIVRNNSATQDLVIDRVVLYNGDANPCTYDFHVVKTVWAGTGGGEVIGTNMNSRFGNNADATGWQDEEGNAQGTVIQDYIALVADTTYTLDLGIALGSGHAFGIDQATESDSGGATIFGYFVDRE